MLIRIVLEENKTKDKGKTSALEKAETLECFCDSYKFQEICGGAAENDPCILLYVRDRYKTLAM